MKYLIFLLCLSLVGCDMFGGQSRKSKKQETATQKAIQNVLDARNDIRQVISHTPQNDAELAAANQDPGVLVFRVDDYVKRLRTISLKGCPEDFKTAFVKYAEAWNDRAAANPHLVLLLVPGRGTHEEKDPEATAQTEATWRALKAVVAKYMANAPKSF